jgi:phosphatidylserine/phosphatidylglycerophosphate/cardiolipin synthase-like enzyme
MARHKSQSSHGLLGWMFGSKKKSSSKKSYSRYVWMFLAFVTGTGGVAGASQYDVLRGLFKIVWNRIEQAPLAHSGDQSPSDFGPMAVYFTQPGQPPHEGDIAHAVVKYVDATQQTLDVCCFELNNQIITDAIVRAVKRGVKVRFVTETDYLGDSGVAALRNVGVVAVDDQRSPLMHNKFMVFDKKAIWTGSMNFTENCAYHNDNNGVYIEDAKLAENYTTKMNWMHDQRKFGAAPSKTDHIPNPLVTLSNGTQVENYFSTHDHPASHVIDTLKLAKKSIHFLAFSFTHAGITDAMLERHAAGAELAGVFEKSQTAAGHSSYFKMHDSKLPVYLDANPRNMHHKVIIIDGEIVIFGSFNFSDSADKSNDENLLIVYNRAVAAKFEEEYQRVYKLAQDAAGR